MTALPFEIPNFKSVVVHNSTMPETVLRTYMQANRNSEVRDDNGGSNFFLDSQCIRTFHSLSVENINIYINGKALTCCDKNDHLRDGSQSQRGNVSWHSFLCEREKE